MSAYEEDLDVIADVALRLIDCVREEDPRDVHHRITTMCHDCPEKAAQVMMALAIWFDPNTFGTPKFWERVESISTFTENPHPHDPPPTPPIEIRSVRRVHGFDERYREMKDVLDLPDWIIAKRLGISFSALSRNLQRRGWPVDPLLTAMVSEEAS